jgi:hypothetical protein
MLRQYPITAFIIVSLHEIKGESLSFLITKFGHAPHESDPLRRGLLNGRDSANAQHSLGRLLRMHDKRPCSRRAADKCDEFASPHRLAPQEEGLTLPCCGLHCASRQILAANVRFGSKADIAAAQTNVRFVPKADICSAAKILLFDHHVGAG